MGKGRGVVRGVGCWRGGWEVDMGLWGLGEWRIIFVFEKLRKCLFFRFLLMLLLICFNFLFFFEVIFLFFVLFLGGMCLSLFMILVWWMKLFNRTAI